jgi:hypothetical protein
MEILLEASRSCKEILYGDIDNMFGDMNISNTMEKNI